MSVVVYSWGLAYCSVCAPADMPLAEVEQAVNVSHPTGLDHEWGKADDDFVGGEPNPTPCNDDPLKLHYLMSC